MTDAEENKTLVKKDIIDKMAKQLGFTPKESQDIFESTLDIVKDCLVSGETVKISGFGNFEVKEKRERRGRNPQTGEDMTISKRRVLTFKASQKLRKTLNP